MNKAKIVNRQMRKIVGLVSLSNNEDTRTWGTVPWLSDAKTK